MLLLTAILTAIYVRSSTVWRKVDRETELLREVQVAMRYLERDISTGNPRGLTRGLNALAVLSCQDNDRKIHLDDRGQPYWQKYLVTYVDADGILRGREVLRPTPSTVPVSFEEDMGKRLDDYLADHPDPNDRRLTHSGRITELSLTPTGDYGSLYILLVEAEQDKVDKPVENIRLQTNVSVRNE
jgi:hypothetical protein